MPEYTFLEPDFEMFVGNVSIIKEGGRVTEQTFAVNILINEPIVGSRLATQKTDETVAAGINYDFRTEGTASGTALGVNSMVFEFSPNEQSFTFNFFINSDEVPEGTEGFRLASAPERGVQLPGLSYPTYQPPSGRNAHVNSEITIMDNDSECMCHGLQLFTCSSVVAVVGFEQLNYTVNESDSSQEVCYQVFNPPSNEELLLYVNLQYQTRTGLAGSSSSISCFPLLIFHSNRSS